MGILDEVGKIAGAVVAVEAAEKLDPDASLLTKGIAAVAGFKGAAALEAAVEKKEDEQANTDSTDGTQSQA
ncbi:hypothetical protein P3W85_40265 [Cupriavidus basilensis]|uniref:Uncharacterized protein n=1 Tax=Cupriavidus basilensis TaxID=68895 RepID=A0ABT6B3D0_9BURK|nr:hypothetical protein [Cupriavidus basilensis]MDF3839128.1 hypothetical protein [Cupriavidus basilensis]